MDKYINFIILMKWLKWLKKTASSKRQSFYDTRLTHMLVFLTQDHLHDSRYSNAGGILIRMIPGESSIQNTVSTRSVMLKKPRKDWDLDTNRISSFRTRYTSTSSTISSSDTLCQQPTMHPTRPLTLTTMSPTAMWPMRMHAERLLRKTMPWIVQSCGITRKASLYRSCPPMTC